jgi:hypothetical protein
MFPCHFAATSHRLFAFELEQVVEGESSTDCNPEAVANPNVCELGKWIAANRGDLAQNAHFRELEAHHQRFHEAAGEMICRHQRGDVAGARAVESGDFKWASDAVLAAIELMGDEMKRRPLPPSAASA